MRYKAIPYTVERLLIRTKPRQLPGVAGVCLEWQMSLDSSEYGIAYQNNNAHRAHRLLYELVTGKTLTPNIKVCHSCDNSKCLQFDHLWAGTQQQNMQDCSRKGRLYFQRSYTNGSR